MGSKAGRGKKEIPAGMVTRGGRGGKGIRGIVGRSVGGDAGRLPTLSPPSQKLRRVHSTAAMAQKTEERGGIEEGKEDSRAQPYASMSPLFHSFPLPFHRKRGGRKGGRKKRGKGGRAFQNGPRRRGGRKSQTAGGDSKQSCRKEERGREEEGRWKTKKELSFSFSLPLFGNSSGSSLRKRKGGQDFETSSSSRN